MSTVQEFSKLNGYAVKDATARQQVSDLTVAVGNKVGTTDIVDNLLSDATNKPLSAKQGKVLSEAVSNARRVADGNAEDLAELEETVNQNSSSIGNLGERIEDLENKNANYLSIDSTAQDFNNALEEYRSNAIPIVYFNNAGDVCTLASYIDTEDVAPIVYFVNAREKKLYEVITHSSNLHVTERDLDKPITVSYSNEELTIGE